MNPDAQKDAPLGDASSALIRPMQPADLHAITRLHDRAMGPGRFARTAYRVREGAPEISEFCRVAVAGSEIVAAVSFTQIVIGGTPGALLLGPLAVAPGLTGQGHSARLIPAALEPARQAGIRLVILVGDLPFYMRFGFAAVPPGRIIMPGPVNPERLLGVELSPGALGEFSGRVKAAESTAARASAKS